MLTFFQRCAHSENPGVGCLLFLLLGCLFFIGWNWDGLQFHAGATLIRIQGSPVSQHTAGKAHGDIPVDKSNVFKVSRLWSHTCTGGVSVWETVCLRSGGIPHFVHKLKFATQYSPCRACDIMLFFYTRRSVQERRKH